jgi:hypothetical protein
MKRKLRNSCAVQEWDSESPTNARRCGRPLPCLMHTPYEPEYAAPVRGPRRATAAEIAAGSVCANCLHAVEIHDAGKPATAVRCLLHDEHFFPSQVSALSCNEFVLPPILCSCSEVA